MAQTPPPGITPAPTPAPQRGDRSTFSSRVDAFVQWLSAAVTQFGSVASNVYGNAVDAFNSAAAAAGSATAASTSAGNAAGSATAASGSASAAAGSATAAATSASTAAGFTATSTTSNAIGTGSKTFATQAGKQFTVGVPVRAANSADPTQYMAGTVTSYSGTSLVVSVTAVGGTGTVATWNLTVTGEQGAAGPAVAGANVAGNAGKFYTTDGATGSWASVDLRGQPRAANVNSGTATQTVNYNNGEGQSFTMTGAHTLTATGFPVNRTAGVLLHLDNYGAFALTTTNITWVKADGTETTNFATSGITFKASGRDRVVLYSFDGTTIYGIKR